MCYNCGGLHFKSQCRQHPNPCPKCQRTGHLGRFCRQPTCSNDTISVGTNWRNPSQGQRNPSNQSEVRSQNPVKVSRTSVGRPSTRGRVFTISGAEAAQSENLIEGTCILNGTSLNVLFDSGATHSFISESCVRRLKLPVLVMKCEIVVSTPTNNPVTTSHVRLHCPIQIEGKSFLVNLICLPLSDLDVILGMDWLSANHVLLDCQEKTLVFDLPKHIELSHPESRTINQVGVLVDDDGLFRGV
ncbi:uncharacterized protein LOC113859485 [Abrus precatorius]|uniref:Uncharacterized protein LOC113859485 n=1 Tax=Abrus precatorius TaxID=3816 RepID=A0A8B8KXH0_ABRPR|nr:uncharacterized protein LOC113859485 [Abrus precatorius]